MNHKKPLSVRDMILIAFFAALLFVQEEALSFLPNIQLTVFLIVLYSKKLGFLRTSLIVLIHVILDNLVAGSFNLLYVPFMLIGWLLIPILLNTIFKNQNQSFRLALLGVVFSLLYCWIFMIPQVIILQVRWIAYLSADIPFEIMLASSSFLSILWLYNPCAKIFDHYIN